MGHWLPGHAIVQPFNGVAPCGDLLVIKPWINVLQMGSFPWVGMAVEKCSMQGPSRLQCALSLTHNWNVCPLQGFQDPSLQTTASYKPGLPCVLCPLAGKSRMFSELLILACAHPSEHYPQAGLWGTSPASWRCHVCRVSFLFQTGLFWVVAWLLSPLAEFPTVALSVLWTRSILLWRDILCIIRPLAVSMDTTHWMPTVPSPSAVMTRSICRHGGCHCPWLRITTPTRKGFLWL
jgi:hypothetical protein